ncbi:CRTAC1 family protein [Flavobacteriaceae bacterium F89]|uniref:CRTAC1 family protein n=1 Tax=Cerina litoralis TaxID=2874477 RepID=A0AAE3EV24_9FLAO|nr:CRTAC1 family protein [Cerina litoralis]MCG2461498.1 CRTAC1 family protein [Cerina litoralis]
MKNRGKLIKIALVLAFFSFGDQIGQAQPSNNKTNTEKLFTLLPSTQTGIDFKNTVTDTEEANSLIYELFYNGAGVAIDDINNDGLPDIYFAGNQVGDKLYLNMGNLKFKDITQAAGIMDRGGWSKGVNIVDINGDGFKDIYVCKNLFDDNPELRINELYINNGDLTFTESARKYGLNDPFRAIHANFLDFDKDGDFDLYLINQPPNPSLLSPLKGRNWLSPDLTYRFLENTTEGFKDVTAAVGLENVGYGLSSVVGDFNNDQWPDLYVTNDYEGPDFFYINNGDGTFTNKANEYLKHISFFSMGSDVGDINNDGLLDLAVVDMVAEDNYRLKANMGGMNPQEFWNIVSLGGHYQYMFNTLQLNNGADADGNLVFSEIGQLAGMSNTDWSWSALFADFDNNGFQDLYVSNGIKKDIRNTDALKNIDAYLAGIVEKYQIKDAAANLDKIREYISLDSVLAFFPSEKIPNYVFKNKGGLNFVKAAEQWGIDQPSFSSGAAYGDLDNDGDLDLVVNNVDDVAFIYENNSDKLTKNNFLNIKFTEDNKHKSFFGTRASIYYEGGIQIGELTSARGFYSSSESLIHFGLGATKQIDSLVISWYDGGNAVLHKIKPNRTLVLDRAKLKTTEVGKPKATVQLFKDVTQEVGIDYLQKENSFDDFEREVLLPHKMSAYGPGLAVGDVNGDDLEDFFVGGAVGQSGSLFLQALDGTFARSGSEAYSGYPYHEDMGAEFIDADLDGDLDLYVVSGGNEYDKGIDLYQDRFYTNDGHGNFSLLKSALPRLTASGSRVFKADYDKDDDMDVFVCGRQVPGHYPEPTESYLLKNSWKETGLLRFEKVIVTDLVDLGMVTDASWTDYDQDGDLDLIVVGEWMPVTLLENKEGSFKKVPLPNSLQNTTGWWYSIQAADFDHDGDDDYVIGNLGLNYKYKANPEEPFTVNYGDFDQNGKNDIVLGYYNYGEHYPLRGRSCSSQQIPGLKKTFPNYDTFASASLTEVYGADQLNGSLEYKAHMFQSIALENLGNGKFKIHELPVEAQVSSINDFVVMDVDKDGVLDLILAGNMYGSEVETPRNDAGIGLFLKGNGNCSFKAIPMTESGLSLPYDVKELKSIKLGPDRAMVVGINNGPLKIIKF